MLAKSNSRIRFILLAWLASLALIACNLPGSGGQSDDSAPTSPSTANEPGSSLIFKAVDSPDQAVQSCPGGMTTIQADLSSAGVIIKEIVIRARPVEDESGQSGEWLEWTMQPTGENRYQAELELAEAVSSLPGANRVEYWLTAVDEQDNETYWPEGKDTYASLPVEACAELAQPTSQQQAPEYAVHDYGASPTSLQYGGCGPTTVTFSIVIQGFQLVDSVEVKTSWFSQGGDLVSSEHQLTDQGPAQDYPGSHEYATTIDLGPLAQQDFQGDSGQVGWNIYTYRQGQETMEYPLGGPPQLNLSPCPGGFVPVPTATQPIIVIPLATATPPILINPGLLAYSQGEQNMPVGATFDLDEGELGLGGPFLAADFHLDNSNQLYLGAIDPFEGAAFGWFGDSKPSKAQCQNTALSGGRQTIQWPDYQDEYFCYQTNADRYGWLRVDVWVSLPLNERRLEFSWFTFP
jgi:hypothetical protein